MSDNEKRNKLEKLTQALHAAVNQVGASEDPMVGAALSIVHLQSGTSCVSMEAPGNPMSPSLSMAVAILATLSKSESNPRVSALVRKAARCAEQALKLRTGEVQSHSLH